MLTTVVFSAEDVAWFLGSLNYDELNQKTCKKNTDRGSDNVNTIELTLVCISINAVRNLST